MTEPTPEPVEPGQPIDPVVTDPPTEPANPSIADLLSAKSRMWAYALLRVLNAIWVPVAVVLATQVDNIWAAAVPSALLAGVNAAGFTLSHANVPVTARGPSPYRTRYTRRTNR